MSKINVGIVGVGTYLPERIMTAKEISDATKSSATSMSRAIFIADTHVQQRF